MAEFFQNCWGYQIWTCGFMWFQVGKQFLDAGGSYSDVWHRRGSLKMLKLVCALAIGEAPNSWRRSTGKALAVRMRVVPVYLRGRSQLSTFMKAYTAYARGEGVWDHRTLFPRKSKFIFNH